jgi:hypothetical protein
MAATPIDDPELPPPALGRLPNGGRAFGPESLTSTPPHAPFRALQITRFKDFS